VVANGLHRVTTGPGIGDLLAMSKQNRGDETTAPRGR